MLRLPRHLYVAPGAFGSGNPLLSFRAHSSNISYDALRTLYSESYMAPGTIAEAIFCHLPDHLAPLVSIAHDVFDALGNRNHKWKNMLSGFPERMVTCILGPPVALPESSSYEAKQRCKISFMHLLTNCLERTVKSMLNHTLVYRLSGCGQAQCSSLDWRQRYVRFQHRRLYLSLERHVHRRKRRCI